MPDRLVTRVELGRMPFRRRPVAEPGTTMVLQMADGRLLAPEHPFTAGETLVRRPTAAFAVDVTPHGERFECELPSASDAIFFSAVVEYTWIVRDALEVVTAQISSPAGVCQSYLMHLLPSITSRIDPAHPAQASRAIAAAGAHALTNGLDITWISAQMRMDAEQAGLVKNLRMGGLRQEIEVRDAQFEGTLASIRQTDELARQDQRQQHYARAVAGGWEGLMAVVIAQDPVKAQEILNTRITLSQQDDQRTLEAIKLLIDGGEIRPGDLDGAVEAAVGRIKGILDRPGVGALPHPLPPIDGPS